LHLEFNDLAKTGVEADYAEAGEIPTQAGERILGILKKIEAELKGDGSRRQNGRFLSLKGTLLRP
jgi:hypothetical protein